MSESITVEQCEICTAQFNLPMMRYRAGGGWQTGDGSWTATYGGEDLDDLPLLNMVCPDCSSSIANVVITEIDKLTQRKGKGKTS